MTEARRAARGSRKLASREALREAALRLALERGPDNVPEADIAAAAGVPLRVYQSCFSSAEQAIVAAVADEQKARLVSAVASRLPRVPFAAPSPTRSWRHTPAQASAGRGSCSSSLPIPCCATNT